MFPNIKEFPNINMKSLYFIPIEWKDALHTLLIQLHQVLENWIGLGPYCVDSSDKIHTGIFLNIAQFFGSLCYANTWYIRQQKNAKWLSFPNCFAFICCSRRKGGVCIWAETKLFLAPEREREVDWLPAYCITMVRRLLNPKGTLNAH